MKHYILLAVLALFLFTQACELAPEEVEISCLPVNVSITLVQGS